MTEDAQANELEISVGDEDGATVLRVEGEIDLATADRFASGLRSATQSDGLVVVDLTAVPFMDSSGLKALLAGSSESSGRLALALSPESPIASLLEMAGVSDRFSIHPSPAAAIDARAAG